MTILSDVSFFATEFKVEIFIPNEKKNTLERSYNGITGNLFLQKIYLFLLENH